MTVETLQHNNHTVEIMHDEDCESPREMDSAAVFVCFHNRYRLGDKDHGYNSRDYNSWNELENAIVRDHRPAVILPIAMIDHSGISLYIGSGAHACDPGGWDSGQVGFAFVSRAKALAEWGGKRLTKKTRLQAEKCLRAELEEYDAYVRGECYAYVVTAPDGTQIDSCGGFIGLKYCQEEALRNIPETKGQD